MTKDFWHYAVIWRARFSRRRRLRWRGNWLQNGYCQDCRYCCGPQDSDEPYFMALMPDQIRSDLDEDFYLFNSDTAYIDARGCKSATPRGCRLARPKRPLACGIFPLVPANGGLYLYKTCPAVLFTPLITFAEIGFEAARWLAEFSPADLAHISLNLSSETLARGYISLDIRVIGKDAPA